MIPQRIKIFIICFACSFLLLPASKSLCQDYMAKNIGIGIHAGSWKPNNLADEPSVFPFNDEAARLCSGLFILSPQFGNLSFRASIGLWSYTGEPAVYIIPFAIDIKQQLIKQSFFSPYICVGGTIYWGYEGKVYGLDDIFKKENELGYGVNLGFGFDLYITKHWALFTEFDFHYAKFRRVVGTTDDYSGSKLMGGFFFVW